MTINDNQHLSLSNLSLSLFQKCLKFLRTKETITPADVVWLAYLHMVRLRKDDVHWYAAGDTYQGRLSIEDILTECPSELFRNVHLPYDTLHLAYDAYRLNRPVNLCDVAPLEFATNLVRYPNGKFLLVSDVHAGFERSDSLFAYVWNTQEALVEEGYPVFWPGEELVNFVFNLVELKLVTEGELKRFLDNKSERKTTEVVYLLDEESVNQLIEKGTREKFVQTDMAEIRRFVKHTLNVDKKPHDDSGLDTGLDNTGTGMDTGTGLDTGTDMDTCLDTGMDMGLDTGMDTGMDTGTGLGFELDLDLDLGDLDLGVDLGVLGDLDNSSLGVDLGVLGDLINSLP